MKSIRSLSEDFIFELFEKFSSLVYKDGEDTEFYGIKVLEERENFVRGTIINSTCSLYIRYVNSSDRRADEVLKRLIYFIEGATSRACKTWGKLSMLRGLAALKNAKLIDKIPCELMEKCKISTDYSDFFDKESLSVINLPSNYLQVALACAALREKLGFENDGYSKKITEALISVMNESPDGWMDEAPPYRRFDRYSFLVSSELSDTFMLAGIEYPKIFEDNLKLAAKHCLFMANNMGDGWNYGRSLSCHGDGAISEILSSAISRGLLNDEERALAVAYSAKITEKILTFWFDKERDSFNIWWDGRSTNGYRQVHRCMQVGLDMGIHLLSSLSNFTIGGVADIEPNLNLIPSPDKWLYDELLFSKEDGQLAEAVFLRYKDTLAMLPIIGLAHHVANSAYMPYPAICRRVESAPEGPMPFLIPEYVRDGVKYRPCQYFTDIDVKNINDTVRVNASGMLAKMGEKMPLNSGIPFSVCYTFDFDKIDVEFNTDYDFEHATMVVGTHGDGTEITASGFEREAVIFENPNPEDYKCFNINTATPAEQSVYKYMTPHGFITEAREYSTSKTAKLRYTIKI